MKKFKWLALLLCVIMVISVFAGCNKNGQKEGDKDKYGGTMVIGLTSSIRKPMYFFESSNCDGVLRDLMCEKLFTYDQEKNVIPRLATDYVAENNNTKFTVHLRKDVKWADGEKFTAKDVLFYFNVCENATSADIHSKPSEDYPGLKISAPDDYTLVYELDNPMPLFAYSGLVDYVVLPEHIWKDVDLSAIDDLTDVKYMMGLGPFSPTEIKVGEEMKLVRNEYYWEMKPYLDGVIVRILPDADSARLAFENGEVNLLAQGANYNLYQKLNGKEGIHFEVNPSGNMYYYLIDCEGDITKDVAVRHALNLLCNREAIKTANNAPLSKLMTSVFTSADIGYEANTMNEDCYTYNPEKAKQILDEAGWKVGSDGIRVKDGVRLSITQLALTDAGAGHLIFIDDCKAAGIEVTVKIIDRATLYDLVFTDTPNYQIYQNGSTMGPTCDGYYTFYGKGVYNNFLRPEYKELFDKATAAPTVEEQTKIYSEISRKVSDEFPCIWLYENMRFRATSDYLNLDECNCTGYYHMWVSAAHAYFEKK